MTKEERRQKFIVEHPNYNPESKGNIFSPKRKPNNWRVNYKHIDYFSDIPRKIKIEARKILNIKIKKGEIIREKCKYCKSKITHGHHTDYSDPLKVVWLCKFHHNKEHKSLNRVKLT